MKILAIEQSTSSGSVAILRDATVMAQTTWHHPQDRHQHLFAVLPSLLEQAASSLEEIEGYAVGTGPGSFSGIRSAISVAQGFALPRRRLVAGIGSAEALALAVAMESSPSHVVIVGDARRNQLWAVRFAMNRTTPVLETPLGLINIEEVRFLMENSTVASPDWDRIGTSLERNASPSTRLIREIRRPEAGFIGLLATERIREGKTQSPKPLYLHPAVCIPPKFPGSGTRDFRHSP